MVLPIDYVPAQHSAVCWTHARIGESGRYYGAAARGGVGYRHD